MAPSELLQLLLLIGVVAGYAKEGDKCFHRRQKKPGVCRPLSRCPSVAADLSQKVGAAQLCSSQRPASASVCCPDPPAGAAVELLSIAEDEEPPPADTSKQLACHRVLSQKQDSTPISGPPGTIARTMCRRYARHVCARQKSSLPFGGDSIVDYCESHNKTDQLIVGGREARPKEYPHMALLGYGDENNIAYLCGGILISPNFVMTAAHCVYSGDKPVRWVVLGARNRTEQRHVGSRPQLIAVSQRITHPDYKPPLKYNDIALLRLKHDATFEDGFVRPACLSTEPLVETRTSSATTSGWGLTEWDGEQSSLLMTVTLNLTSLEECQKSYKPSGGIPRGIISSHVCAGSPGKDSCEGDSGGPLQLFPSDPYCMFQVVGVVSFGQFCGFKYPGVYTRVAAFLPWIEGIVWHQGG